MMMRGLIRGFRKGEKGFTLIELLVVIAILGIIAAIVVPNFGSFFGRGQDEANELELRMVKTATVAYASEHGSCPADTAALSDYFEGGVAALHCTYTATGEYPNCGFTPVCPED